uniref:(California timema) hypothetical protein n=1 Tax=Timema californicum TaxID=61474 RepID=A0A7R9JEA3_TIMCA|nr:unnamed protein product [Timema californicum]
MMFALLPTGKKDHLVVTGAGQQMVVMTETREPVKSCHHLFLKKFKTEFPLRCTFRDLQEYRHCSRGLALEDPLLEQEQHTLKVLACNGVYTALITPISAHCTSCRNNLMSRNWSVHPAHLTSLRPGTRNKLVCFGEELCDVCNALIGGSIFNPRGPPPEGFHPPGPPPGARGIRPPGPAPFGPRGPPADREDFDPQRDRERERFGPAKDFDPRDPDRMRGPRQPLLDEFNPRMEGFPSRQPLSDEFNPRMESFPPRGPPHPDDFDILPLGPEDFDNRERHQDDFDRRAIHEEEFDRRNRRPDGFELRGPPRDGFDPRLPHPEEFDLRDPRLDGFDPRGRGPGPDFFPREGFGPMGMMGPRGPGMGPEGFGPRHFMGPRGPGPMFHPRGPPGPMGMRGPRPGVWIDGQAPPGVFPLFEGSHPPDGGPPDSFFGRPPFDEERRGRDRGGWEHRGPRRGGPPGREEGGRFPRRREEINPRGNRRDEDDKEPRGDRERKSRWSNASPVVEGTESVDTSREEKEEPLELGAGPPIEGEVSIEADTPKEPEQGPELEFQDSQGDSTPCNDELELVVLEPIEAPEAVEAEPTPSSECAPPVEETAE